MHAALVRQTADLPRVKRFSQKGHEMTSNAKRQPNERQRAIPATQLRIAGKTYPQIAAALGYRDPSGVYRAVTRLLDRQEAETADQLRKVAGERYESIIAAYLPAALAGQQGAAKIELQAAADHNGLYGLNMERTAGSAGISEAEFGEMAAELLKVTGPGPLVELAAAYLPPGERPAVPVEPAEYTAGIDGWSNIGDDTPRAATDYVPVEPAPVVVGVVERVEDEDQDDDAEQAEPIEEVAAELVDAAPRPRGQHTISADAVLDRSGVPIRDSLDGGLWENRAITRLRAVVFTGKRSCSRSGRWSDTSRALQVRALSACFAQPVRNIGGRKCSSGW